MWDFYPSYKKWIVIAAAALLTAAHVGCQTKMNGPEKSPPPTSRREHAQRYPLFDAMRGELGHFTYGRDVDATLTKRYYRKCTADLSGARHQPGFFEFNDELMAVHAFFPTDLRHQPQPDSKPISGTVFVLHGYLSHALDHAALINRALRERYVVIAPELPGHGLSGGKRGGIDSFHAYGTFLQQVITLVEGEAPEPWHIVGHSTGALSIIEYLRDSSDTPGNDPFRAVVLSAPLIRSWAYHPARLGRFLTRPFIDTVSTKYDSPLSVPHMPLSWFDAQVEWNKTLRRTIDTDPPIHRELLVLQGNRDTVVAWRHNRKTIRKMFPKTDYQIIPGGSHTVLQKESDLQKEVLDQIFRYLDSWTSDG